MRNIADGLLAEALIIEPVCSSYHISWPLPHLLVYPPHVFPNYSDPENGDPDKEEEDGKKGKDPLHLGADNEAAHEEEYGKGEGEKGGDNTEKGEKLQRDH